MADQQDPVGMPSGSSGNQVAAGFRVDSSSLQQLHKTWRLLIQDVNDFNKALTQLNQNAGSVDRIQRSLANLHSSLGGRSSASGTNTAGATGGAQQPATYNGKPPGQTGAPNSQPPVSQNQRKAQYSWAQWGAAAAGGMLAGAGSYMQAHLQNIMSSDSYYLRSAQSSAGAYGGMGAKNDLRQFVFGRPGSSGLGGISSTQDFLSGQSALESQAGWGLGATAMGRQMMTYAGQAGQLMGSYAQGAQATGGLYTPQAFWALRSQGITSVKPGGAGASPQTIAQQLERRVYGNQKVTAADIAQGMRPGAPLAASMSNLGLDPSTQQMLGQIMQAYAQGGPNVDWTVDPKTHGFRNTAANRAAGITNNQSLAATYNALTNSKANTEQTLGAQSTGQLELSMNTLRTSIDELNKQLGGLLGTGFGTMGAWSSGPLGAAKGILNTGGGFLQYKLLDRLLGGGAGAGTLGRLGGGSAAEALGLSGSLGGAAALGGAGLIATIGTIASQLGGDAIQGKSKKSSARNWSGSIFKGAGTGASIGAGVGLLGGPFAELSVPAGAAIGGVIGGVAGGLAHAFGDGKGSGDPFAQGGSTVDQIIALGKPTGAIVTSSYRPGGTSYHAAHEAVDFGVPGNDPAGLAKVAQWWASHYGSELAELIYTGPGGITIKNGKVIPESEWNSFWGASTVEEHRGANGHVHVAATPASLRMGAGGVATAGGSNGNGSTAKATTSSNGSPSKSTISVGGGISGNYGSQDLTSVYAGLISGGTPGGGGSSGYVPSAASNNKTSTGTNTSVAVNAPGSVKDWAAQGLKLAGKPGSWLNGMVALAMAESGGQNIIQGISDVNSAAGNPAFGPWQMIKTTFDSYAVKGHTNWKNPVDEAASAANYIASRYGDPGHTPGLLSQASGGKYKGYAVGTWELVRDEIAQLHKGEMVLPEKTAQKVRQLVKNNATPGAARGQVVVQINAPITVAAGAGLTQQDATNWWNTVKSKMQEDDMLASLGAGAS